MEILLDCGMITKMGNGFIIAIFLIVVGTLLGILLLSDECWKSGTICLGIAAASIMALMIIPECSASVPTNVYQYVVEVTDENKYKELIDDGYSLDKLYENRNIYKITGDALE